MRPFILHIAIRLAKIVKSFLLPDNPEFLRFRRDDGNALNLRSDGLNENSLVFDIGGYVGQWASDIYAKYNCHIHVFEPVASFAAGIAERFAKNTRITVNAFGLSDHDGSESFSVDQDSSSLYRKGARMEQVQLRDICGYMREAGIESVDLVKINIEGGEYPLLKQMIQTGYIEKFSDLLIQFHRVPVGGGGGRSSS